MRNLINEKIIMAKTKHKLSFVRLLYIITKIFRLFTFQYKTKNIVVKRKNIHWNLDLNEAIDYCLYLTGDYEPELIEIYRPLLNNQNLTVLDIGANIGAHTLKMASFLGSDAAIYAIEPTNYAYDKLKQNISLNHDLKNKIRPKQVLLTSKKNDVSLNSISASWDIERTINHKGRNIYDGGFSCDLSNSTSMTLDKFVEAERIDHIDLIKLDVDGNEIDILDGAVKTFKQFKPILLIELSPIHFEKHRYDFTDLLIHLKKLNYEFKDTFNKKVELNTDSLMNWIPRGTLVNIIGYPV